MRQIVLGTSLVLASLVWFNSARADENHQQGQHQHGQNHGQNHQTHQTQNQRQPQHQHGKLEIPAGQPVPTIDLEVTPDEMGGWNLQTKVTNFKFAPESIAQSSVPTEGHAHLYINGKKVTRLYGSWYYLGELPTGPQSITVTLNTNRHEDLFYKGKRIEATKRIIVFPAGTMHR